MDLLDDPIFKSKYQKNKLRVKLWESDFMEKYGRKPNKNDIKEADATIKEAYKMYWKLKTHALEESLMDITFCDDTQSNLSIDSPSCTIIEKASDKSSFFEDTTNDTENIDPHKKQRSQESISMDNSNSSGSGHVNVKGVWGSHLSKSNTLTSQKKQGLLVGRSHSFQLSQNKFTSGSFTKRNPRKSLSLSKIRGKPDVTKDISTNTNIMTDKTDVNSTGSFNINEDAKLLFGRSLKVVQTEAKPVTYGTNVVQNLIEGQVNTINRNLNHGWLERCSKENNLEFSIPKPQRLSGKSDSGIESIESGIPSPKENIFSLDSTKSFAVSDEEDFICNSDSEEERKNKRIRNFKKRLSNEESHVNKRQCADVDTSQQVSEQISLLHSSISSDSSTILENCNVRNTNDDVTTKTNEVVQSTIILPLDVLPQDSDNTLITENVENNENTTILNNTNDITKSQAEMHTADNTVTINSTEETNDDKKTNKKRVVRRRPIKRRKQMNCSDSNLEYSEDEQEKVKKKVKKVTRTRTRAKKTNADKDNNDEDICDQKTKEKKKKTTRVGKKKVKPDTENDSNPESNSTPSETPIYGIETFTAVPRFALNVSTTGDLLADFSKSVNLSKSDTSAAPVSTKPKGKLTDKEKLEQKIATGRVNENFVRINMKKKVFVRGKKAFNFSKYKKNQWKQRKKELASSETNMDLADLMDKNGTFSCFKCGETGHFSKNCPSMKTDVLMPLEDVPEEVSLYPTLEEAEKMASQAALAAHSDRINRLPERASRLLTNDESISLNNEENSTVDECNALFEEDFEEPFNEEIVPSGHKIPEELLSRLLPPETSAVSPLYSVGADNSLSETPEEVFETLRMFGHTNFRPGQENAIMRILSGQSTLVTLSTGSGKSLCYQLPAYLYSKYSHCITLVISPLVSLMDDQLTGIPSFLSAACLHTGQTPKVRNQMMEMVKQGNVNILLVSPEAVVAGEKSTGFGALLRQLPPISFACIDEAHCISQWSHNFRPSYLMISRVLKEKLKVKTVLGLTATATKATAESIVRHLNIHDGLDGVISDVPMPRNLLLTISKDEQRDHALVRLLKSERFEACDSVIIYCTRREECVRIAALLRISLQDNDSEKPNAKVSAVAEAYHAGLTSYRRRIVQKAFMSNQIRIVVATVAFGMGINKADIRSVIHYNMPATFEGYVQEVGRAGRDGLPAQCHLFLSSNEDRDKWELRRHIYANGVDRYMIRRLLEKVFVPCSCTKANERFSGRRCAGHEVAIPVDETVKALDIPEETISTLLCYLELHPKRFITVLSSVYVMAKVSSYGGPQALKKAAQSSPPLAMAIALDQEKGISHDNSALIEFPVVDVASAIGWDSGVVKSHLKNLEWQNVGEKVKRSAISVQYHTLGLRVKAPGDLGDSELDEALEALYNCTQTLEMNRLKQLEAINISLHKYSVKSIDHCLSLNENITKKSDDLKDTIRAYFDNKSFMDIDLDSLNVCTDKAELTSDIRSFILTYKETNFTGRAVARILHGIQSPNYPAFVWSKCRFWRLHISTNFNTICQIATKEILSLR